MKFSASTEKSLKTVVCVRLIKLIMNKIKEKNYFMWI